MRLRGVDLLAALIDDRKLTGSRANSRHWEGIVNMHM